MSVSIPVQDRLFSREYKRCRFPVDNALAPGDRVMAAVPGGIVFISRRGLVYPGKRTLMFCSDSSPRTAEDLLGGRLCLSDNKLMGVPLCMSDLMSVAFTGSMLILVAEGTLEDPLAYPQIASGADDRGVWCLLWNELRDGRISPIHMISVPQGVAGWGTFAGSSDNVAFLCGGVLSTSGIQLAKLGGSNMLNTPVSIEGPAILALSGDSPQMLAVVGGKTLTIVPFDSPNELHDSVTLEMSPTCMEISKNGQMVALGYSNGLLEIRDTRNVAMPVVSIIDLSQACTCLAFSGSMNDRLFAASPNSGEILVVDTRKFTGHQKFWLPAIPRPSESLSRYDLRDALWPTTEDVYELPGARPEDYIATLSVTGMIWLETDGGVLAVGTNEGVLFIQCQRRPFIKSLELM